MKKTILIMFAILVAYGTSTAEEPRLILVEQLTTSSDNSPSFLPIANQFNQIVNSNTEVIPLTIHMNFNPDLFWDQRKDLANRILFYKAQGQNYTLPSFFVNGSEQVGINGLQAKINAAKNKKSPYKMKVQAGPITEKLMIVDVKMDIDENYNPKDLLFCAVIEKHIVAPQVGNSNESDFYYVTRKIDLQPTAGDKITRNDLGFSGNRFNFFVEEYWNLKEIYAIAWVQNSTSKEVMQAEKIKMYNEKPTIAANKDTVFFDDDNKNKTVLLEVYNSSMGTLNLSEISVDNKKEFSVQQPPELQISPGMSKLIPVKLLLSESGEYIGNITIKSNADNTPNLVIPIRANIVKSANPVITTDVTTLDFGKVGKQKTEIVAITNTGNAALTISSVEFTDNEDGVFSIPINSFSEIEQNTTLFLPVNFKPTNELPYFSTMIINSNASNEPILSIPIKGEGENLEQFSSILVNKDAVDFGSVRAVIETSNSSIVIQNVGNQPLEVKNSGIEKDNGSAFSFVGEKNITIPADGKDSLVIEFSPKSKQDYTAILVLRSNDTDPAKRRIEIDLVGKGLEGITSVDNLIQGLKVRYIDHNFVIDLDNNSISNIVAKLYSLNGTMLMNTTVNAVNGRNIVNISMLDNNQVVFFKLTSDGKLIGTGKFVIN